MGIVVSMRHGATTAARSTIKIVLTPEQREQVRRATGRAVTALELTAEELEERVAPGYHVPPNPC